MVVRVGSSRADERTLGYKNQEDIVSPLSHCKIFRKCLGLLFDPPFLISNFYRSKVSRPRTRDTTDVKVSSDVEDRPGSPRDSRTQGTTDTFDRRKGR